jgi:hypothetical protein
VRFEEGRWANGPTGYAFVCSAQASMPMQLQTGLRSPAGRNLEARILLSGQRALHNTDHLSEMHKMADAESETQRIVGDSC